MPNQIDFPHPPCAEFAEQEVLVEKDAAAGRHGAPVSGDRLGSAWGTLRAGAGRGASVFSGVIGPAVSSTRFLAGRCGDLIPLEGPEVGIVRRMFAGTADQCGNSWWSSSFDC